MTSLHQSFPDLAASLDRLLQLIHASPLLDILLLLGVLALLYIYVWQLGMTAIDFVFSIFVLPFSPGRILNATLGYYLLCAGAVGIGAYHVMPQSYVQVATIVITATVFALIMWDTYEKYVPVTHERLQVSRFTTWCNVVLAILWTGVCAAAVSGSLAALFPFNAWVNAGIAVLDAHAWVSLLVRLVGFFCLLQTLVRGFFAAVGTIQYCKSQISPPSSNP
jgi:hypothetical protein